MPLTYTSQDQIEVYRFSVGFTIVVPLIAVFLQAFIPLKVQFFSIFDLPLLVVIFFAVARRSQVAGLLTGSIIGLLQDSLTHQPIGVYGIAKTVVGYGASSHSRCFRTTPRPPLDRPCASSSARWTDRNGAA